MQAIDDHVVAAGHSMDPAGWQAELDALMQRVAGRFARVETRQQARALVQGLVSDIGTKNCWTLAEHAGDATPDGVQHLLRKAVWDADAVRDDVRDLAVEHFGGRQAVLVLDETGDLKKGSHTVGVQRQYTGTARRIENAQVAVFATYATDSGHTHRPRALPAPLLDRRPGLTPGGRRARRGRIRHEPQMAAQMVTRAMQAGVPPGG